MVRPGGFAKKNSRFVVLCSPRNTYGKNIKMYIFPNV